MTREEKIERIIALLEELDILPPITQDNETDNISHSEN